MITNPEKAINTDVPRSGCLKIRAVGRSTSTKDTTIFVLFKGIEPDAIYRQLLVASQFLVALRVGRIFLYQSIELHYF